MKVIMKNTINDHHDHITGLLLFPISSSHRGKLKVVMSHTIPHYDESVGIDDIECCACLMHKLDKKTMQKHSAAPVSLKDWLNFKSSQWTCRLVLYYKIMKGSIYCVKMSIYPHLSNVTPKPLWEALHHYRNSEGQQWIPSSALASKHIQP